MTLRLSTQEFNLIRDFLHERSGIFIGDNKKYFLESRLYSIVEATGCHSFGDFYRKLKHVSLFSDLFQSLMDAVTTNETLWFRDQKPFDIYHNMILSAVCDTLMPGDSGQVVIWSAACATGQEPYSIAMKTLDYLSLPTSRRIPEDAFRIVATDISADAVSVAAAGRYDALSMGRGMSSQIKEKYFERDGNSWCVKDAVRRMIQFKKFNLKDPIAGLSAPFDVIFLRNVIIYFSDAVKEALLERIRRVLKPNGYLILGAGESVTNYSDAFQMLSHEGFVYYQRK